MLRLSQVSSVVFYWVGTSHRLFHRQVVEFDVILNLGGARLIVPLNYLPVSPLASALKLWLNSHQLLS